MKAFDYIIVGAGSAGCVLANRLSADPTISVCLIESGPIDSNTLIHVPFGLSFINHVRSINWNYKTETECNLNKRNLYWPRGKTLGGSSSINAMCYIRGNPENYNAWSKQGCEGWDWDSVLPYFKKAENNSRGNSQLHGSNGPLSVNDLRHVNPLTLKFVESGKQLGMAENFDFNGMTQEGIGLYQVTQKTGERCSSAKGYLTNEVKARPNLFIWTSVNTKQILIENKRAVGALIEKDTVEETFSAKREVILSAGAIGSPQILMQSGIGERKMLEEMGIECQLDLPGVGKNLQDHLDITLLFKQKKSTSYGLSLARLFKDSVAPLQYMAHRRGMLTSNVAEGAAFFKSDENLALPDIQVHFLPALLQDHGRKKLWGHGFTIHVCHLYPKSKGTISLKKMATGFAPVINANYLGHEDDVIPLVSAFKWARNIGETLPLADGAVEFKPGKNIRQDKEIEDYIRENAETLYHPIGTCRMGQPSNKETVVNSQLQVIGIAQLRVIDASVMPSIVGGNTNAPTIMIAEKAAELIIRENGKDD